MGQPLDAGLPSNTKFPFSYPGDLFGVMRALPPFASISMILQATITQSGVASINQHKLLLSRRTTDFAYRVQQRPPYEAARLLGDFCWRNAGLRPNAAAYHL